MTKDIQPPAQVVADEDLDQAQGGIGIDRMTRVSSSNAVLDKTHQIAGAGVSPFQEDLRSSLSEPDLEDPTRRASGSATPLP
ncbi:MAG: hypothetical protein AB8B85_12875 [Paracoccaceae bacterium]